MIECAILLEACDPNRNIFRSYFIKVSYDLFNRLMVEVVHGRIGSKGKRTIFHVENKQDALDLITTLLKRREGAIKRFGEPYRLKQKVGSWDIDEILFPFRQDVLFDGSMSKPKAKNNPHKEIIRYGEGLFR